MKLGVLLFNLGGPETLDEVRPFLFNLFSDPEIVRLPFRWLQKPLAWLIATSRYRKSSGYYRQIGGGSPLRRITEEQAQALKEELRARAVEANVYIGMRYWRPSTSEAIDKIERDGIRELIILPLYPQFSVSTTGSSCKDFVRQIEARGGMRSVRRRYITRWHTHPSYISALSAQISKEISRFPDPTPARVHLLFSAHSVPQSYIERGDPYLRQTEETMDLVLDRLGRESPAHLCFQSKVGPVRWLEPSTEQKLRALGSEGVEQVLMVPISFVSEHIETLYELDILYRKVAAEIGLRAYRRVPAFNCDPAFIGALADLVTEKIDSPQRHAA